MRWKTKLFYLAVILFCSCKKERNSDASSPVIEPTVQQTAKESYLIQAQELASYAQKTTIKFIDFRKPEAYATGHIAGAISLWRNDIEDHSYPYGGMMAKKDCLEELFSGLGISNDDVLVVYDDQDSCDATRFWWVLQNYDFPNVRILNGGLKSWTALGEETTVSVPHYEPTTFRLPDHPSFKSLITKEEVMALLATTNEVVFIDTRSADEYSGKRRKKGAMVGGRIPNSHFKEWTEAIDYGDSYMFKSVEALEKVYGTLNLPKDQPIITYCHTGVRSAHTAFVLTELLGYTNVRNYDGSWSEWSYFKETVKEKDSSTTILQ